MEGVGYNPAKAISEPGGGSGQGLETVLRQGCYIT